MGCGASVDNTNGAIPPQEIMLLDNLTIARVERKINYKQNQVDVLFRHFVENASPRKTRANSFG